MKIITDYLREEITFCKINNNKMFYKTFLICKQNEPDILHFNTTNKFSLQ